VAATRASHSAQPASASAPKTQDTSGHLSQPELLQCDQVPVSLKTSRDIAALGFPTSCKTWQEWVTERRGAWRARVNAARRTKERGSSSWPTISVNASKNSVGKSQEHRNSIPLGTMAAMQAWPTPIQGDSHLASTPEAAQRRIAEGKVTLSRLMESGQAAPASSSSLGSRQGLWLTPRANEPDSDPNFAARNADRGAHCHGTLSSQAKEMWPTITAHTPDMESNGPNGHQGTYLAGAVKQWATPQAKDHKSGHRDPTIVQYKQLNVEVESRAAGKLNPRWVETLMGLPIGWTMPSCTSPQTIAPMSCDSSAMESACPPLSGLGEFSLAS
jgi:hypothetical protein